MNSEYSCAKAAEIIKSIEHFKKCASKELSINWGQIVILAHLASPDISYLSSLEIIQKTGMDRCYVYRNLRILLSRSLIDSVSQPGVKRKKALSMYSINGKGSFYLTQVLMQNGISMLKAFEDLNQ